MKKLYVIFAVFLMLPLNAVAAINVFACEPEWKALAEEIGGASVKATSATTAFIDPHYIRAKPSLIAAIRKADLVICSGAGLEAGWLPILLQKSGHARLQPGQDGFLLAADYVPMLEKPVTVDRSMGDVHPEGNPHIHLNPHNIALVAAELNTRLQRIDSAEAPAIQKRYTDFAARWIKAIQTWEQQAAPLAGKPVVVHHPSWVYLLDWLKMESLASLEPKPGIPPTATHLEDVLQKTRTMPPYVIIRTPYETADASEWLADKIGAPAIQLPYTVGGDEKSADLFGLFDRTIALLNGAKHAQH